MIIHDIDYLITVDSAYLHLAGAIGTKAIALIAKRSDYRWMLERKDSILYPSVRVVRQKANLIWDDQERQEMVDIIRGRDALSLTGK
jgi:ADP-heptose:LPS heptosyltransferase